MQSHYWPKKAWKPYQRGTISTVGLLVIRCLDQLLYILEILYTFLTKQVTLMRRSTVLILPPQLVFPEKGNVNYNQKFKTNTCT